MRVRIADAYEVPPGARVTAWDVWLRLKALGYYTTGMIRSGKHIRFSDALTPVVHGIEPVVRRSSFRCMAIAPDEPCVGWVLHDGEGSSWFRRIRR